MKSTLKIDYSSRSNDSVPVIRIIQPKEIEGIASLTEPDYDVRDKLIRDFLQRPGYVDRNSWFKLDTYYPNDHERPTADITNIAAVKDEELFNMFFHSILNRIVPYDDICAYNMKEKEPSEAYYKIHNFFNWLENEKWCSWAEQHPFQCSNPSYGVK